MSKEPSCIACHDSGWIAFDRIIRGKRYPWAAACQCDKGLFLSNKREHHAKSGGAWADPVIVQPIDREIYYQRAERLI